VTRLIAVFGASPGIGKTTLTGRIAAEARRIGRVDRFDEQHILSRRDFATVAAQFRASGVVDLDVLLDASARFVASAMNYEIVVTDTLFPFVPSLLAWGHDDETIRSFLMQLRAILEPLRPVVVYLDGEPAEALPRAASRGGDVWLQTFLAKVTTYKTTPPIRDLAGTVAHLRHERDVTLGSVIDAGFTVVKLRDAHTRSADDLAAEALSHLDWLN
jgi:hypothetical protein